MGPSQDSSGKWRFSSGSPILKMIVISNNPGGHEPASCEGATTKKFEMLFMDLPSLKTNIASENGPSQKETILFQSSIFGGFCC